ncbi:MAG: class I tRNA ligase family protein, partial [Nitrososphaerales archaeon]
PDVLVCWFDSGVASFASLGYPKNRKQMELWYPADFIVEGRDQISGWFFSLLKGGAIIDEEISYKSVLMHGFVLDENGREMHKSRGNYVTPSEVITKYGRDALRLFVIQNTLWEDLKFSSRGIEEITRNMNVIWNSYVFAGTYMILDEFDPNSISIDDLQTSLRAEDKWILSKTQELIENLTNLLNEFRLHDAMRALMKFFIEDLSHTYIRLIRRRTWTEEGATDKFSAYYCLYQALRAAIILLAPFSPFLSEKIYVQMFKPIEAVESVHLVDWPKPSKRFRDSDLEGRMEVVKSILTAAGAARMKANLKLRQPLKKMTLVSNSETVLEAVEAFKRLILEQANVKGLVVIREGEATQTKELEVRPNFQDLGPKYKRAAAKIGQALQLCSAEELRNSFEKNGEYILTLSGTSYTIMPGQVEFAEKVRKDLVESQFNEGSLFLDTTVSPDEVSEGLARDLVRRMQQMRKEMDLNVDEYVEGYVLLPDIDSKNLVAGKTGYIEAEVRVKSLKLILAKESKLTHAYVKKWEIGDDSYEIGLNRLSATSLKRA